MTLTFASDRHAALHKERKQVQAFQEMPLIQTRYLVDGYKYYCMAGGIVHALEKQEAIDPKFLKDMDEHIIGAGQTFEVASINLSKSRNKPNVPNIIKEFLDETGTIVISVNHKRDDKTDQAWDQILVCHDVKHADSNPDLESHNRKIVLNFYAFMLNKHVIDSADVSNSGQFTGIEQKEIAFAAREFRKKQLNTL